MNKIISLQFKELIKVLQKILKMLYGKDIKCIV
jgi:hypothetical protein